MRAARRVQNNKTWLCFKILIDVINFSPSKFKVVSGLEMKKTVKTRRTKCEQLVIRENDDSNFQKWALKSRLWAEVLQSVTRMSLQQLVEGCGHQ